MDQVVPRDVHRLVRQLAAKGAYAALLAEDRCGIFLKRFGSQPVAIFSHPVLKDLQRRDLLVPAIRTPGERAWKLSPVGLALNRRLRSRGDPFLAQHQIRSRPGGAEGPGVNHGESPLSWLRRRRGSDGRPLLDGSQYRAGERLRGDFTGGGLMPRTTVDWDAPAVDASRRPELAGPCEAAMAARKRFSDAMRAVGPSLADVLVDVCCHLNSLKAVEQRLGWPQRSAKVVLAIALDRLAAHYRGES